MELRAVIHIPAGQDPDIWLPRCLAHAQVRRHQVVAVGATWEDATAMVAAGAADLIISTRRGDLDPDRLPRVECVGDAPPVPVQRRARRLMPPTWRGRRPPFAPG